MLEQLKKEVLEANLELPKRGLVTYTWGNVSGIDREAGLIVIKPSGVPYDELKLEDLVVLDLDGNNATSWAQAGKGLPAYGTTHADYFYGEVPCTRLMTKEEIGTDYEKNTGLVICETFGRKGVNPIHVPGVLTVNHGPFSWGKTPAEAVHNAVVLEEICKMGLFTRMINPEIPQISQAILDKHFLRKHGENAYYGQKK